MRPVRRALERRGWWYTGSRHAPLPPAYCFCAESHSIWTNSNKYFYIAFKARKKLTLNLCDLGHRFKISLRNPIKWPWNLLSFPRKRRKKWKVYDQLIQFNKMKYVWEVGYVASQSIATYLATGCKQLSVTSINYRPQSHFLGIKEKPEITHKNTVKVHQKLWQRDSQLFFPPF